MYKRILTAGLLFGMVSTGPPAYAMTCMTRTDLVAKLTTAYAENLTARGLQNERSIVEVWASAETGSYTILLSRADGMSCVLSAGTHWLAESPVPAKKGVAG
tara:strand:+ start:293 stop:598 length:306 start_codon:yes stop_codon:yes gene_type:complete